jgi:hypothetical protein
VADPDPNAENKMLYKYSKTPKNVQIISDGMFYPQKPLINPKIRLSARIACRISYKFTTWEAKEQPSIPRKLTDSS